MTRTFDPKQYRDKKRIYVPVAGTTNVLRLYVWNVEKAEYRAPTTGKCYLARRWERTLPGRRERKSKYFETLADARSWQAGEETHPELGTAAAVIGAPDYNPAVDGKLFREVIDTWKIRRYPTLAASTRFGYDKRIRLYFEPLLNIPIRRFTPKVVDEWIAGMIATKDRYQKGELRKSFREELALLTTILHDYAEYADDPTFVVPVKKRHRKAIKVRNRIQAAPKNLKEDDLRLFLEQLRRRPSDGPTMAALATLQFYQAVRISEAAALRWEDVRLDLENPRKSRITFTQHVVYIRGSREDSFIEPGMKNSDALDDGVKEHPILPEVFAALAELHQPGARGLIFCDRRGEFLTYSQIQNAYNRAFAKAGLPFRSTHVMRHGGSRKSYNETRGDLEIAKQHLGNRNLQSVLTYAQREASAFTEYAGELWDRYEAATETPSGPDGNDPGGRTRSQPKARLTAVK